jgi:2-hydroxycyclohexanecarboxyl-CoA dehydrogenase
VSGCWEQMVSYSISGRVALVSGGGSGIGRAIALGLGAAGVATGVVDLSRDGARATVAAIQGRGGRAHAAVGDVGVASEVAQMVTEIGETLGPIDILVNCAGIFPRVPVAEMDERDWDRTLATNLKSVFLLSRETVGGMVARGFGRIISITSDLGSVGSPGGAAYAASKAGINAFTRSLAKEVSMAGVTVNCVAPGLTDTPMMRGANTPDYIEAVSAQLPGGLGRPEDVVGLALFLASDAAKYVSGQIFSMRG